MYSHAQWDVTERGGIMGSYGVLFSSRTGNTRALAEAIRAALPQEVCVYFGESSAAALDADTLYIGFWTDKGNADEATVRLLEALRNRRIFLFGTAGFGGSEAYFQKILDNVKRAIDPSNTVIGTYMCQGRMPQTVRERYVKMKGQPEHPANLDALIENFDRAMSHPDGEDLRALQEAVLR